MQFDKWHSKIGDANDLRLSSEFRLISKLYKHVITASLSFFEDRNIEYIMVPATTGTASSPAEPGSDSAPVVISIDDKSTMLMDSAQFHLEYACRAFQNGCFYFGHSFRNEIPDSRHLSQFFHVEAEIPGSFFNVKELVYDFLRYMTSCIWNELRNDLEGMEGVEDRINELQKQPRPFNCISFDNAFDILKNYNGSLELCAPSAYRITPYGEKILIKEFGNFIWIENWNKMAVPFYQATDFNYHAINGDLLFGIGEVVGAGQRHFSAESLKSSLNEHGLDQNIYSWYIDMKEKYPLQTAGFGLGVERYLMWLLGVKDIRDIELFPRDRYQKGII